jgi:hypothetical protein
MDKHIQTKTLVAFDHMRLEIKTLEFAYHAVELYRKLLQNDFNSENPNK